MGAKEMNRDDRDESESSGIADIMEIAEALGSDEMESEGHGITRADADDDLDHVGGGGYGAVAATSLLSSGTPVTPTPAATVHELKPTAKPPAVPPAPPRKQAVAAAPLAAPVVARPAVAATTVAAEPKSNALKWALGAAALFVIGGAAALFISKRDPAPNTTTIAAAPVEPEAVPSTPAVEPAAAQPVPNGQIAAVEPPSVPEEVAADIQVVDEQDEPSTVVASSSRSRRKSDSRAAEDPSEPAPEPAPAPTTATPDPTTFMGTDEQPKVEPEAPKKDDSGKYSSECLLNPNAPGCGSGGSAGPANKDTNLEGGMPEKLSETQIRSALSPHKSRAKACGAQHGVEAGTVVRVKLSIEGATGKVVAATAMSPHESHPAGQCVAEAFKGAEFPRFKTPQQGTVYPVRF